ncbi:MULTISPECIES: hypothetical protein [Pseudofrankia]|uniref:hypothetical protein n=1 Tax=Pseudofrankia TaxID=2994363 RepID=UPI00056519BD|nr:MULTISPECIES: hypothetical protein [Pseudofrankia]OHV41833.1 hypothetical protein BCD49_02860 [Pseudofrankia sp. EUN1h]
MTSVGEGREILGKVSLPWLYDANAFRVTGLAVTASRRDIRRVSDRVRIAERLGEAAAPAHALALTVPVTAAALSTALDRLRDPRLRLVDEFFWLWPSAEPAGATTAPGPAAAATTTGGATAADQAAAGGVTGDSATAGDDAAGATAAGATATGATTGSATTDSATAGDPALAALAAGDVDGARRRWIEAASTDGAARHNLAVLAHLRALDAERAGAGAASGAPDAAAGPAGAPPRPDWREVYWLWAAVLADEACWNAFEARIAAAGDARLGVGLAAGIRSALPDTLLASGAALVAAAVDAGDLPAARAHLAALRELGAGDLDAALRAACEPWLAQVRSLCADADRAAQDRPATGLDVAERVLTDAEPTMARIDELLPPRNLTRIGIRDQLGQTVLTALLLYDQTFVNAAGEPSTTEFPDHFRMRELLRRVTPLVESAALAQRIGENLDIVERQATAAACYYCQRRRYDKASSLSRPMHRVSHTETTWNGRRIHYQSVTVTIPRCRECALRHQERRIFSWLGGIAAFLVIVALATVVGSAGWGVLVGAIAFLISVIWGRAAISGKTNRYPPLIELRAEKWLPGAKPAGS